MSFFHEGPVEQWVREVKQFHQEQAWRELKREHLSPYLLSERFDSICYVPSDPRHFSRRGFDSSFTLGKRISKLLGIFLETNVFRRKAFLKAQHEMSRKEREKLPVELIQLNKRTRGQRVLLIDDVMTSGASLSRCASLLKAEGCEVSVYVVSRKLKAPLTLQRSAS